ncbi:hypothetical protein Tco_0231284 [Tanacetum coccineum]
MMTRSAYLATAAPQGGRTGGRTVELKVDLVIWEMVGLMVKVAKVSRAEWQRWRGGFSYRVVCVSDGFLWKDFLCVLIITVNVIPPDYDHDVPIVEPNQHDDAPVVPEHDICSSRAWPNFKKFKKDAPCQAFKNQERHRLKEEDPQEDEDDMEIDIEEDENEPELTYPYEEDEGLIPVCVYEVGESFYCRDPERMCDRFIHGFMDTGYCLLFLVEWFIFESLFRSRWTAHALVEKKGLRQRIGFMKVKHVDEKLSVEKEEGKLKASRLSHTFLRDLCFEKEPNEAIDVSIEDEKSPLSEPRGSPPDDKDSVDVTIAAEGRLGKRMLVPSCCLSLGCRSMSNAIGGSRKTVNQMPWTEMKQLMTAEFYPIEEIQRMEHELWNLKIKEYDIVAYT